MDHALGTEVYYHQTPRGVLLISETQQSEAKEWTLVMKDKKKQKVLFLNSQTKKNNDSEKVWK